MKLPAELQAAIETAVEGSRTRQLFDAAAELSESYRRPQPPSQRFISTEAHRLAYAAVRMPGTYAAIRAVFSQIYDLPIKSMLDLGAGPGTAGWAGVEIFPDLEKITFVERDDQMIRLGRKFAESSTSDALKNAECRNADLKSMPEFPPHDLVVCSYSLNEMSEDDALKTARAALRATGQILAIIEPGTIKGFESIRRLRGELIEAGGHLLAPCPHDLECPMSGGDWCHFSRRFERSSLHRRLKGGELGFEDEKFSYIIAAKSQANRANARIIRHPQVHSGYIKLRLCTKDGLKDLTVTKRSKEEWKRARKADWGDQWDSDLRHSNRGRSF